MISRIFCILITTAQLHGYSFRTIKLYINKYTLAVIYIYRKMRVSKMTNVLTTMLEEFSFNRIIYVVLLPMPNYHHNIVSKTFISLQRYT